MTTRLAAVGGVVVLILLAVAAACHGDGSAKKEQPAARRVLYYVDPMHPSYRSDKPGTAPDCGMDLEPVYADTEPSAKAEPTPGAVAISSENQQLFGVRVETVKKGSESRVVRTTGHVEVDGDRLHRMMAGTDGWVESVENNPVGTLVKKDDLLATLYSREFRNAQQAYLGSLVSLDRMKPGHEQTKDDDSNKGNDASLRINEEQLRALGMGTVQIQELRKTRKITSEITLNAPDDGVVLSRAISPGQRFVEGSEFYRIADLRRVWITADVFGDDAQAFRPGTKVRVAVRERPASVEAVVSKAPPFFDSETRTLKVRLEANNPGLVLRPDMFVDVEVSARTAPALTVPIEALLDSGRNERVFVERAPGQFESRAVKTGWRTADRVEILSGLAEGDRVVASGAFLVDSESQLRTTTAHD